MEPPFFQPLHPVQCKLFDFLIQKLQCTCKARNACESFCFMEICCARPNQIARKTADLAYNVTVNTSQHSISTLDKTVKPASKGAYLSTEHRSEPSIQLLLSGKADAVSKVWAVNNMQSTLCAELLPPLLYMFRPWSA